VDQGHPRARDNLVVDPSLPLKCADLVHATKPFDRDANLGPDGDEWNEELHVANTHEHADAHGTARAKGFVPQASGDGLRHVFEGDDRCQAPRDHEGATRLHAKATGGATGSPIDEFFDHPKRRAVRHQIFDRRIPSGLVAHELMRGVTPGHPRRNRPRLLDRVARHRFDLR